MALVLVFQLMLVGVQGIGKTSLLEQLRQEGTGSYKRKPPEHWAKRMGNKNVHSRTPRGVNLSTVGVDIGDWVYEKKVKGHNHGPVTFRYVCVLKSSLSAVTLRIYGFFVLLELGILPDRKSITSLTNIFCRKGVFI